MQKAKVEVAIYSWVLAHSEKSAMGTRPSEREPGRRAPIVPQRSGPVSAVPGWKQLRPRAGKPWTADEDAALLREFEAGLPLEKIARRRQRGVHAIEVRLFKLGRD